jgi:AcrR family transcriptional regulator
MKTKKRRYTLKVRGRKLAATRARIVEATMQLHQELGPRRTTISAIAERAGVERLTVYRHFPDEAAVFAACSSHYAKLHPPPDPAAWTAIADPTTRIRRGLRELYRYFSRTHAMLDRIYRDTPDFPSLRTIMDGFDAYLRQLADAMAPSRSAGAAAERRTATLRHAVRFATWQSLQAEKLNDDEKADLILRWLDAG